MNDEMMKKILEEKAEWIKKQISNGTLYGDPIDMSDPEAVLVASYLLGINNLFWFPQDEPNET